MASELARRAQLLSRAARQAADFGQSSDRLEAGRVAQSLEAASRSVQQASRLLHLASLEGRDFVARNAAGRAPGSAAGPGTSPDATLHDPAGRYVHPGTQEEALFQQLVHEFGATNPSGWIGAGNPHYGSGMEMWTNNCGPCSRSFADTFHGKSAAPALGDSRIPPGEGHEMWDALGARPASRLTNTDADPREFSASAYRSLENSLRRQGPGAVAIIGVDWDVPGLPRGHGGGHWFNAYVDHDGTVRWADEQVGQTSGWPPGYTTEIWRVEAVVRTSAHSDWKELTL